MCKENTSVKIMFKMNLLRAQGVSLIALWGPKWKGNPKERGYMYTYS